MILSTISQPSNPTPIQAAQRHRLTGREDVRVIWQTGQRCSYRADGVFRAAVGGFNPLKLAVTRGTKPA